MLFFYFVLQSLQSSSGTLKEVAENMFKVISSPSVDETPWQNQCRKCAVVGNSGNLLGSKYGALIDSHSAVIRCVAYFVIAYSVWQNFLYSHVSIYHRMNKAVMRGYELDVGNRTTHHFMYPESAINLSPGVRLVLLPFKLLDMQWLSSALSTGEITMYVSSQQIVW